MPRTVTITVPDDFDDAMRTIFLRSTGRLYGGRISDGGRAEFVAGTMALALEPHPGLEGVAAQLRDLNANLASATKDTPGLCTLCGQPMPPGEEMFKFHGYSGPCPPKETSHGEKEAEGIG